MMKIKLVPPSKVSPDTTVMYIWKRKGWRTYLHKDPAA